MDKIKYGFYMAIVFWSIAGIIYGVYFLAKNDIFFTLVKEGTAKVVLKFSKIHKILVCYTGYKLDSKNENVVKNTIKQDQNQNKFKIWSKKFFGGLYWIGIPKINKIYTYENERLFYSLSIENEKITPKVTSEKKRLNYISLKDELYYAIIQEAETQDMVPVDLYFQLTFRIIGIRKALFEVEDWIEMSLNQFKPVLRDWIATKKIEELIGANGKAKEIGSEAKELIDKSDIDTRLKNQYGIKMDAKGYGIALITLSGTRGEDYVKALTKNWEAKQEVKRMNLIYKQIKKSGEIGAFTRLLEALEKTSQNPNKMIIFPLGSIQDMIRQWTGNK